MNVESYEMKICTYTVKRDRGFAPNPFYGYCTLAHCTPNHMNARLRKDDYIVGFIKHKGEPCLLYWMIIDEVLDYDAYYRNPKYKRKKPNINGTWISRCGDNIYYRGKSGQWKQATTVYHKDKISFKKDTRYAVVYIGKKFSYHGKNAHISNKSLRIPIKVRSLYRDGRGIRYIKKTSPNFDIFLDWLKGMPLGRQGDPRDLEKNNSSIKYHGRNCSRFERMRSLDGCLRR